MKQPSDNKEDWRNEKGVQDASFQDFVAPLLAGLGGVPRGIAAVKGLLSASSKAPAIASGLGAAAPKIDKLVPEFEGVGGSGTTSRDTIAKVLMNWADSAQQMGDVARMKAYKRLQLALDQSQISPDDVMDFAVKIHADPQGL